MDTIFHEISRVAALLCERAWAERNAGNLSLRLDYIPSLPGPRRFLLPIKPSPLFEGQSLLMTAAGVRMRDLRENPEKCLVVLSFHTDQKEAMLYGLPEMEPSSELLTHLMVQASLIAHHPEEKALLHSHVTELIVLTHHPDILDEQGINDTLLRMHAETSYFLPHGVAMTSFQVPGSLSLAEDTAKAFQNKKVCIWPKHGALASGTDIQEAFDRLDIIAKAARIWLTCKSAGFSPEGLSSIQMEQLRTAYEGL